MKNSYFARLLCAIGLVLFVVWMVIYVFLPPSSGPIIERVRRDQLEISALGGAIETYKGTYDVYPEGDGAMIFKRLSGDNPQKIKFMNAPLSSIGRAGFLDSWGTPYSITVTNGVVIASAGKDKIFGSKDDLVFNSLSNGLIKP
jgi:hypothetical protein